MVKPAIHHNFYWQCKMNQSTVYSPFSLHFLYVQYLTRRIELGVGQPVLLHRHGGGIITNQSTVYWPFSLHFLYVQYLTRRIELGVGQPVLLHRHYRVLDGILQLYWMAKIHLNWIHVFVCLVGFVQFVNMLYLYDIFTYYFTETKRYLSSVIKVLIFILVIEIVEIMLNTDKHR